jgi:hypothetical protein
LLKEWLKALVAMGASFQAIMRLSKRSYLYFNTPVTQTEDFKRAVLASLGSMDTVPRPPCSGHRLFSVRLELRNQSHLSYEENLSYSNQKNGP